MIYINGRFLTQKLTGVQRFAYEMLKGLMAKSDVEICILVPPNKIDESYEVSKWPIKVIGFLKSSLWEQLDLPIYLLSKNKPFLVNLINTAPCFYSNQIVSIADMTTFVNPKWFNKVFAIYYQKVIPLIVKNSLHIITVSQNSKNDIVRFTGVNSDKITVINNAVSESFLIDSINDLEPLNLLEELGLRQKEYVLAVSSLDPRKNFVRLIEAFILSNVDIPLVIVGSKGKAFANNDLEVLVNDRPNIIFTGYVTDPNLVSLYQNAKVFVYPSLYEGFGIPPLEAMSVGCPTIVSNTSSLPEVCGNASFYVNPENTGELANAIKKLCSDRFLQAQLIHKGYERFKYFSWQKSTNILIKLIKEYHSCY